MELNSSTPKEMIFFLKPETAIPLKNQPFFIPEFSEEIHHEIEVVIKICKTGKHIEPKFAHTYFDEFTLGIDFTARDIQNNIKKNGEPWEKAKAFDYSAPLSRQFIQKSEFKNLDDIAFSLEKNGKIVQKGNSQDMLFDFDHLICYLSQFMTLKIGDLIFTGTPAGVGPVKIGDQLIGYIEDKKMLDLNIK